MNTLDSIVTEPVFDIIVSEAAAFWVALALIVVLTLIGTHYRKPYFVALVLIGIFPLSVGLFLLYMFQISFDTWLGVVLCGTLLEILCLVGSINTLQWSLRRSAPLPLSALRRSRLGFVLLQSVGCVFTALFLSGATLLTADGLFNKRDSLSHIWAMGILMGILYFGMGFFVSCYKKPQIHSLWFSLCLCLILAGFGCILALMA